MSVRRCILTASMLFLVFVIPTAAQERPFQIALLTPVQAFPEEDPINGVRLTLAYGRSASVTGVDLALLVAHTTRDFLGVQITTVGLNEGSFTGVGIGVVNIAEGPFEGLQYGFVNSVQSGRGVQLGGVDYARNFRGLQIGLVNYAETLEGVQVGLINIIRSGGVLPVMPFVNWN